MLAVDSLAAYHKKRYRRRGVIEGQGHSVEENLKDAFQADHGSSILPTRLESYSETSLIV